MGNSLPPMERGEPGSLGTLVLRSAFGGVLMGLANLVPGISGGTMLLASGVYPRFIEGIAELTSLRFRRDSLVVLASVGAAAALAILFLAGTVKDLVVHHRWVMYSLFIGLTLGGIPIVWGMIERVSRAVWGGALAGFAGMVALAIPQATGAGAGDVTQGVGLMFVAGVLGASAMILPGVSGGYLLLVMGVYVPILAAIDACRQVLTERELALLWEPLLQVVVPVGIGVGLGVVAVSHVLRWLLERFHAATLGVLLGLLLGAVVGLWPFQEAVQPVPGDRLKGQTVELDGQGRLRLAETGRTLEVDDYPTAFFEPGPLQIALACGLILAGFAVTTLVARLAPET